MNKNITFLTLLVIIISTCSYSCGDDYEPKPPAPLDGEWLNEKRVLKSNDPTVDERVNSMFVRDAELLEIKRIFDVNESNPNTGAISTLAVNPQNGTYARNRKSTYTAKGDSIFIVDGILGYMSGTNIISGKRLTTVTKVDKQAIKAIITEIGGDINIPMLDDIEGVLTIVDYKE
ncbi:MAG: hypothetical protein ACK5KN_05450 [Dysgonomonas sp.]|jgi:hypothetical protein|uniref:hypothetical protein n=1 Tax=unclassified Dysgonomonas TaxID=2630389 RepID=UPI0025BCA733|nr:MULTISPECIES: hypothetical protein [unclassified Dysgonomonas]MDR1717456.1 hypothetical protein [Prevotella sp.]MDR2003466.1 hypothetical protein [Prevotella sp.]HMM01315.1 hypothetical protein [Dysgonomonas sp.]